MISKKVNSLIVLGLMALMTTSSFAAGAGTTGAQFLKIGTGARAISMGGAFSAVAEGPDAIYWNPAGLAQSKGREASASYIKYFQGVNIGFLGYTHNVQELGTFGVGLDYLSVGDIEKRALDTDARDGTFGATDMAVFLSYGSDSLVKVEGLSLGANVKYIKQTIDAESAQSYALDLGALYRTPVKNLTAGFAVSNIGSQVKFVDEGDPLPLAVKAGAAYRMFDEALLVAVDIEDYINESKLYPRLGAEYNVAPMMSLRAGYKLGMDSTLGGSTGLSAGIGFNIWNVKLDYAFVPFGELSDTHWMSISTKF